MSPSKEMSFLTDKEPVPAATLQMCSNSANSIALDSTTFNVKPEVELPALSAQPSGIDATQASDAPAFDVQASDSQAFDAQASDAQTQTVSPLKYHQVYNKEVQPLSLTSHARLKQLEGSQ